MIIDERGRAYRNTVGLIANSQTKEPFTEKASLEIDAYPPDGRKRDLDNILKALLDAIEKAGVIENDSQFDEIRVSRKSKYKGGKVVIRISEI
ncbi:Crossover junction endodeoxyribonuclease RusA [Poriferisphaera corsica]|uniref:Crossover junction endodeoxyribonuclease RusA n=1 Tax=Poriferisphaera corsica TaxID=2528020 RepID=A0A517YVM6_9BACT|nr:RusA family crossover junction endodeoxyribonuclease [Poriferisphaera corsica]QDU34285.1 Crossover junction endodeoxyribonuclease RusA [Poriferisphaera corsica]